MKLRQQRFREYLAEHGPRNAPEMAAAFPDVPRPQVAITLGTMKRAGILAADDSKPARYSVAREVGVWRYETEDERKAAEKVHRARYERKRQAHWSKEQRERRNETNKDSYHRCKGKRGIRTRAEWLALCATRTEATRARKHEARAEKTNARKVRKAATDARNAVRKAARTAKEVKSVAMAKRTKAVRPPATRTALEQPTIARAFVPKTGPSPKPAMSSDDFIRQGGQVERLPAAWELAA